MIQENKIIEFLNRVIVGYKFVPHKDNCGFSLFNECNGFIIEIRHHFDARQSIECFCYTERKNGQQSLKAFAKTSKKGHILTVADVEGCLKFFIKRLQAYFKDNFKNFNHNINL